MKTRRNSLYPALYLFFSTVAAIAVFAGCAGDRYNRSTGEYIDDKSLLVRINKALDDNPDYKFQDVHAAVFKGTAQLGGFVDVSGQRTEAGNIVKQVQGVKNVVNNITIKDQTEPGGGEDAEDKSTTTRVNDALNASPGYKFDQVIVMTSKGTVQLTGFVNTSDQKTKAGDIVGKVGGVSNVVNNITIKDKL